MKRFFILSVLASGSAAAGCVPQANWIEAIRAEEARYGMPTNLLYNLIKKESQFCNNARSHVGAMGLAQMMPGTVRLLKINPWNPLDSIRGAARYLNQQFNTFKSWPLALAAYNAGPGNVMKYRGIPPFRETRGYVAAILGGSDSGRPIVMAARSGSAPTIITKTPAAVVKAAAPIAPVTSGGPWNTSQNTALLADQENQNP